MSGAPAGDLTVHASCVVIGECGILIRGPSGSGKSSLARELIDAGAARGLFASLVCDDQVRIGARHGRLVARAIPAIAGRIEIRGMGLVPMPHEEACIVRLVIDPDEAEPARLPPPEATRTVVAGIEIMRLCRTGARFADAVLWRLRAFDDTLMTE